jgi:2-polyprenyl-3-methyl-5-hydroxy-6-metoxy-1,4-benzoquinol methylase
MTDTVERNRAAWSAARYEAWVGAMGQPGEAAAQILVDPKQTLRRLHPHLGDVAGRRILNLQGSHGRIAVALAVLGAKVTVIDFAEENQRYALALAKAAGVMIDYLVSDVMLATELGLAADFDWVVLELGILHYHQDLRAFFALCASMTAPGGRLLLNEFHPVQRKLFSALGAGDYFDASLVVGAVPYPPGLDAPPETCEYRFYTLAEMLTAVLAAGWRIDWFEEHPDWDDAKLPGTFTLVATKA